VRHQPLEKIYKAQAEQQGTQPGPEQPNAGAQQQASSDHVEDAQFEEVK
jgi:molecular chaperone DnaK